MQAQSELELMRKNAGQLTLEGVTVGTVWSHDTQNQKSLDRRGASGECFMFLRTGWALSPSQSHPDISNTTRMPCSLPKARRCGDEPIESFPLFDSAARCHRGPSTRRCTEASQGSVFRSLSPRTLCSTFSYVKALIPSEGTPGAVFEVIQR